MPLLTSITFHSVKTGLPLWKKRWIWIFSFRSGNGRTISPCFTGRIIGFGPMGSSGVSMWASMEGGDPASNVMSGFHGRPSGCAGAALLFPAHLWMHTGQSLTCLAERSASILGRIWPKSFASAIRPMLRTLTGHWLLPLKMLGAVIRCLWKVAAVES